MRTGRHTSVCKKAADGSLFVISANNLHDYFSINLCPFMLNSVISFHLPQQPCETGLQSHGGLSGIARDGGKNSPTGNLILRKRSQGLSSLEPTHSFSGIQKSYAGMRIWLSRSRRTIENWPRVTRRFLQPPLTTSSSSKYSFMHCGTSQSSSQLHSHSGGVQLHTAFASQMSASRKIGSTASTKDYKRTGGNYFVSCVFAHLSIDRLMARTRVFWPLIVFI